MEMIEKASEILGLHGRTKILAKFTDVRDDFNPENTLTGYLCHQSDHRYGAMVIMEVNGEVVDPQVIYATPKLHYPFARDDMENRNYHFPKFIKVKAYEKLDGTNICAYSYADANGKRFLTFKVRLNPVVKNSKWGPFQDLLFELLEKFPELRTFKPVLSGDYSLSFELYGLRNKHSVEYEEPLGLKLLFGVRQADHAVMLPDGFDLPSNWVLKPAAECGSSQDLVQFYEKLREEANEGITVVDELTVKGSEGFVFYVYTEDKIWMQFKCKPEKMEAIHWANDMLPESMIIPTIFNAFETSDDPSLEDVIELLKEEANANQIEKSLERIEKCYTLVIQKIKMQEKVKALYDQSGLTFEKDGKREVMRYLSHHFEKKEMSTVFTSLKELGIINE